jgi:hypothetical protein
MEMEVDYDGSYQYSPEIEVEVLTPASFILEQNYPNPFNPSTKIKFQIPERSFVNVNVYDVLGNHIASLASGVIDEGSYELIFDAGNLSSGVYYYKLSANGFSSVKKMILMK